MMKRALRFFKWFVSKCGWFEAVCFVSAFCFAAGLAVGEGTARTIFWGTAIGVNVLAVLIFVSWGVRNMWGEFVKHDEKCFDILKQKDIK
jgi:hypothetical protein